ncbi:hypothetical protein [Orrella sp. 11846]|uniref:hypothetical protein n=1 Tax=Orrella sp. 11846 TaxID=3409913 RepID=UPI003B5C02F1
MSYFANVYNVMIASPGDVLSERAIIRDVIYEWNAVHSNSRKIVLLPTGWETHSSPEMGASAQTIINSQVLEKCDLLVGVFWTRIGTQTDNYASGSVEEIERHINAEKPTMLYFSSQPVSLDTVDSDQIKLVKNFKDSCRNRGLFESYDSHADFKAKFYRQLQLKLNEHPIFLTDSGEARNYLIKESKIKIPEISAEARILLKEASLDDHGTILYIRHLGGTDIQVNGKNIISSGVRREIAKWEQALNELVALDLVAGRGQNGEFFELTNLGYQISEMIVL